MLKTGPLTAGMLRVNLQRVTDGQDAGRKSNLESSASRGTIIKQEKMDATTLTILSKVEGVELLQVEKWLRISNTMFF